MNKSINHSVVYINCTVVCINYTVVYTDVSLIYRKYKGKAVLFLACAGFIVGRLTLSISYVINVNHFVYWENSYFFAKVSNGKYFK